MAGLLGKHPGFKNVAQSISEREHMPIGEADAILASRTRKESAKAKKANPNLNRVRKAKPKKR